MPFPNFQGQVRKVLGPKRCLPRSKTPMAKSSSGEASQRRNLPKIDAGFQLRHGMAREMKDVERHNFGCGGLAALAALPQAKRLEEYSSH
jgi:hypothetical protein